MTLLHCSLRPSALGELCYNTSILEAVLEAFPSNSFLHWVDYTLQHQQTSQGSVVKTVLPNGLRVISEQMSNVRSVAIGVWIDVGSRTESASESGISHFVEHMVFKGTASRTADQIACSIDSIGGHLDAFTTKEGVAFTAKVLDEHLPRAVDVLSDLVLNPAFREADIVKEKSVVLEELKMDEDNPDYLISEIFARNFWKGHPLGRPIIGNKKTINKFTRSQLQDFFCRTYHTGNLVITAAGNVSNEILVGLVKERFGSLAHQSYKSSKQPPNPQAPIVLHDKASLEQVHLCLGVPAYPMAHPKRYAGYLLSTVLGGGISSRLFLKIREHEGLAYTVFSDLNVYEDTGCLSVYAGTSLEAAPRVIEQVAEEFGELKKNLISNEELQRAKDHLKGSLMLSLESTASRMANLARQEKYFGKFVTLDEVNENIQQTSPRDLQVVANEWFHPERVALAALGNLGDFAVGRDDLAC